MFERGNIRLMTNKLYRELRLGTKENLRVRGLVECRGQRPFRTKSLRGDGESELHRNWQLLTSNVLANRHFAVGRVWARLLKPKLGPPQSVRLSAS